MKTTKKKHILFICTEARQRSPTAAELVNTSAKYKEKYEAKAAGTADFALIPITKIAVKWADMIIVMNEEEDHHKTILLQKFPFLEKDKEQIIDFNIPDVYWKNEPELKEILKQKFKRYLKL